VRRVRFTIARLLAVVLACGVAFGTARAGWEVVASATFTLVAVALLTSVVFAVLGRRPFWVGFAVFGWGALLLFFGPWSKETPVPRPLTTYLLEELYPLIGFRPANNSMTAYNESAGVLAQVRGKGVVLAIPYMQFGHALLALLMAFGGASWMAIVYAGRRTGPRRDVDEPEPDHAASPTSIAAD